MKRILFAVAAVAGLLVVAGSDAQAGWGHRGYSSGYGGGYSNYGGYGSGYGNSGYGRSGYGNAGWHGTSHYDYHPGSVTRHGNHYDYQPGHYDLHRSGHWHN